MTTENQTDNSEYGVDLDINLEEYTLGEMGQEIQGLMSCLVNTDEEDDYKGALISAEQTLKSFKNDVNSINAIGSVASVKDSLERIITDKKRRGNDKLATLIQFISPYKNTYLKDPKTKHSAAQLLAGYAQKNAELKAKEKENENILAEHDGDLGTLEHKMYSAKIEYSDAEREKERTSNELFGMDNGYHGYSSHMGSVFIYLTRNKLADESRAECFKRLKGPKDAFMKSFIKEMGRRKASPRIKPDAVLGHIEKYDRISDEHEENVKAYREIEQKFKLLETQYNRVTDNNDAQAKCAVTYEDTLQETAYVLAGSETLMGAMLPQDKSFLRAITISKQKTLRTQIIEDMSDFLTHVRVENYEILQKVRNLIEPAKAISAQAKRYLGNSVAPDHIDLDTVKADLNHAYNATNAALMLCKAVQVYIIEAQEILNNTDGSVTTQKDLWRKMSGHVLPVMIAQKNRIEDERQIAENNEEAFDPSQVKKFKAINFDTALFEKMEGLCEIAKEEGMLHEFLDNNDAHSQTLKDNIIVRVEPFEDMQGSLAKIATAVRYARRVAQRDSRGHSRSRAQRAFRAQL